MAAGIIRDETGQYTVAWLAAAGLCVVAAVVSISIRRGRVAGAIPASGLEPSVGGA